MDAGGAARELLRAGAAHAVPGQHQAAGQGLAATAALSSVQHGEQAVAQELRQQRPFKVDVQELEKSFQFCVAGGFG